MRFTQDLPVKLQHRIATNHQGTKGVFPGEVRAWSSTRPRSPGHTRIPVLPKGSRNLARLGLGQDQNLRLRP